MKEIRFLSGTGGLGAGKVLAEPVAEAMKLNPHFIAADAGTTDSGPFSLGSGRTNYPRESVKHDLGILLVAARNAGIPLLVGSSGTAGIDAQVDWMLDIANEIAVENGFKVRTAAVYSEQSKDYLLDLMRESRIRPLDPAPDLDEKVIRDTEHVVGMMGVEPLQKAIEGGAELVIGGRCSDSALFAAIPIMKGFPEGLAWHAGKVMECGTQVCVKAGRGIIYSAMTQDSFTMRVFGKDLKITPQSVAAHSFYENGDPYIHAESSGAMDLSGCTYEAAQRARSYDRSRQPSCAASSACHKTSTLGRCFQPRDAPAGHIGGRICGALREVDLGRDTVSHLFGVLVTSFNGLLDCSVISNWTGRPVFF